MTAKCQCGCGMKPTPRRKFVSGHNQFHLERPQQDHKSNHAQQNRWRVSKIYAPMETR